MEAGPHTAPPYSVNVSGQHLMAKALKFPVFLIISRDDFNLNERSSSDWLTLCNEEISLLTLS